MAASYPIVNGAEHAWVLHDPRFKPDPRLSNCPNAKPNYEQSAEDLIEHMRTYGVDKVVISHVCYYGRDNRYASHCVQRYPDRFAAIGLIFLAPHQVGQVAAMAERFPGVKVVIDHLAMIDINAPDSEGFGPLLDLARWPNVYIRTSLHNPSKEQPPFRDVWPFLERVYDRFGPRRMVWANFYELLIMQELIPFFSTEDKTWILGKNALEIYFKDQG